MQVIAKVDNEEISSKVRKVLLEMLHEKNFDESGRLPPEEVLAREMGISRTVVRDVLAALESEGYITRRRGVGTVVNRHVLQVNCRLDLEKEFFEDLIDAGFVPSIKKVVVYRISANEEACRRLQLSAGNPVLVVERIVLADGREAIYCLDHIPVSIIKDPDYDIEELKAPIFDFLKNRCHSNIHVGLSRVEAIRAEDQLAEELGLEEGVPILYVDQVGYDKEQNPVLWSKEYYAPGFLHFTVLRRKIW